MQDEDAVLRAKANALEGQVAARDTEVANLRTQLGNVRQYADVAKLNIQGKPFEDGDVVYNTPLSRMMDGTYVKLPNGNFQFLRTPESETKLRAVIQNFPAFPFSYFGLTLSLRDRGDPSWPEYARQAQAILEQTTSFVGHHTEPRRRSSDDPEAVRRAINYDTTRRRPRQAAGQ